MDAGISATVSASISSLYCISRLCVTSGIQWYISFKVKFKPNIFFRCTVLSKKPYFAKWPYFTTYFESPVISSFFAEANFFLLFQWILVSFVPKAQMKWSKFPLEHWKTNIVKCGEIWFLWRNMVRCSSLPDFKFDLLPGTKVIQQWRIQKSTWGGFSRGPKGRVGRVREGCPLRLVGVRGASPKKIWKKWCKMVQSGVQIKSFKLTQTLLYL